MSQPSSLQTTTDRTQAAVALDNLIRRHLRVGDPRDPGAVAAALRERYTDDRAALEQEAAGLPFFKVTRIDRSQPAEDTTRAELRQAEGDVHKDLSALTTNALLKDIHPELRGWSQAIRQAVADGTNAARFALDPWQRDRAMGARRLLSDYARVARYVGALSPNMSIHYRQLAKSLDEVAGVILVLMGDSLANIGYGGRFLLQAPASELQARRDAVIYALRNLVGSTQEGYGPNEWPRGLVAYRQFLSRLEAAGQSDLRALFQEGNVARALDELIHFATRGAAEDLRALGATAQLTLGRFRRLILVSRNLVTPSSPPLAAYLGAIQLFLDAFSNGASGYRLLFISRPPIVFYGLYGIGGPDEATQRLLSLIIDRGQLAELADCYLGCGCGANDVSCQLMLDKVLYDLDRAIDLYALGTDPEGEGEPEQRAVAYGVVIDELLKTSLGTTVSVTCSDKVAQCTEEPLTCVSPESPLNDLLARIRDSLCFAGLPANAWPASVSYDLGVVLQELCLQQDGELQWEALLNTMAPSCLHTNGVLEATQGLIGRAITTIRDLDADLPECPSYGVTIPPHHETSLDTLANDVTNSGVGRENV